MTLSSHGTTAANSNPLGQRAAGRVADTPANSVSAKSRSGAAGQVSVEAIATSPRGKAVCPSGPTASVYAPGGRPGGSGRS